jgi:uncharacterized Ntn-hydrolase superfamily protein
MAAAYFRQRNPFSIATALAAALLCGPAQATFSIVAVDVQTREVGSAGASCLQGSLNQSVFIISDVIPDRGAVHTQAYWNATNKQRARDRLAAGDSPQQIMAYMQQNDVQNNPAIRQYGAVDLNQGAARSAAFTGASTDDWKGHRLGPNYAIQGNILAYQHNTAQGNRVVDSIEAKFLRASGTLADKLMAALQGGKWRGADDRCWAEGVSTQSAFIRVAKPNDSQNSFFLDLRVPSRPTGMDPIDSLQKLFDKWKPTSLKGDPSRGAHDLRVTSRFGALRLESPLLSVEGRVSILLSEMSGETVFKADLPVRGQQSFLDLPRRMPPGLYLVQIKTRLGSTLHKAFLF